MKKILGYVGAGLMVWGLASCSKDAAQGGNATQNGAKKVKITMKVTAPGSTRATVDGNLTDGYVMNWAEGDSFSLMDDQGNAYRMTLQDGADTPDGIFEGEIDANSARGEIAPGIGFMAINPYVSGNTFASYTIAIPADQTTDDTADGGLGNYLFQWGGAAFDASSGDDKLPAPTVQFEQLSTFWEITIANPSNLSIKSVKVKAADDAVEPFGTSATASGLGNQGTSSYTFSNYIATTFSTSRTDSKVSARLAMFSTNYFQQSAPAGTDLQIEVTLDDGSIYVFNRPGVTKSITPGVVVQSNVDMSAPDPLYYDAGVMIGGLKWATRNVDAPHTFAATPQAAGMFYQWNSAIGWSSADPMVDSNGGTTWNSAWDGGGASATTWDSANDPCPAGWRMPTQAEFSTLAIAGTGGAWTTTPANGWIFGSAPNTIFLPAAGSRYYSSGTLGLVGSNGYYWSATPNSATNGYLLYFGSGSVSPSYVSSRAFGFTARCVAK